ncbi:DegT/DnrJ/EryC1/StrS aminotransferase family protein [Polynucleobacter paneuropaeus]|nr:DegT/DnrJ/EryC1/StrS aminotransferase family protein [Polynucleobacter paneuropaeus]
MSNLKSFSSWPSFTAEEADAIQKVLLSNKVNYWTGQECRLFEDEFAKWCGSKYAVALANGTLALDLALKALGIQAGDEVIVTPRTFIASVSCVVNIGAIPVFADVDRNSGNITPETIAKVITPKTRAIICVHLAGWPCDMDGIMTLANLHGIKVIEDCAQAHGALFKGKSVGTIGHIGAWSFCQDKIMTTGGEGGMVTTNDESLWRSMWAYKDHGKSYAAVYEREHPSGYRWLHESFGTNWRMLEMQAAIGRIQLQRMSNWTARRNDNARILTEKLGSLLGPASLLRIPTFACNSECSNSEQKCALKESGQCKHAFYKYYAYLNSLRMAPGWDKERIIKAVNEAGVPCYSGSCSEVYLEKAFDQKPYKPVARLPMAKELGETTLMFLVHPTIAPEEMEKAAEIISKVLLKATQ